MLFSLDMDYHINQIISSVNFGNKTFKRTKNYLPPLSFKTNFKRHD